MESSLISYNFYSCAVIFNSVPNGSPQSVSISVISSEEAHIMWESPNIVHQNGIITGYVVDVTVVNTGQNFQIRSNSTNLFLESLQPFTNYECRVAARTIVGVGPFSISNIFRTNQTGTAHTYVKNYHYCI